MQLSVYFVVSNVKVNHFKSLRPTLKNFWFAVYLPRIFYAGRSVGLFFFFSPFKTLGRSVNHFFFF